MRGARPAEGREAPGRAGRPWVPRPGRAGQWAPGERPELREPGHEAREAGPVPGWRDEGPGWQAAPETPVLEHEAAEPGARPPAPAGLVGPDEEVVAGRRPVEEALIARRTAHRLLVVPQRREALEAIVLQATRLRIPIAEVEGGTLTALAGFDGHQGVALVVGPRQWASVDDILAAAAARGEPPFVLVLDSLEDPQNLGTLLRSADACGVHGVIFPTRNAAPLTPSAIKASAGAVEHLLLAPVDDLPGALVDLRTRGLHLVGTDAEAALSYRDADLRGPLALVVGSEGKGMSGPVRRRLELLVRIPMRGHVGSLNAAVAGSVLLFEAAAQRPAAAPGAAGEEPVHGAPGPTARPGSGGAAAPDEQGVPATGSGAGPAGPDAAAPGEPAVRGGLAVAPGEPAGPAAPEELTGPPDAPGAPTGPAGPAGRGAPTGPGAPTGHIAAVEGVEIPGTAVPVESAERAEPAPQAATDETPHEAPPPMVGRSRVARAASTRRSGRKAPAVGTGEEGARPLDADDRDDGLLPER